ncbi:alpha-ketoacid dehydrogenase subunit beta [Pseudarthrobacter cellobiosi]|uniref:alpha-ketoacid dehydrogenase subunit beta n=1 Tax=Pseudarthrobacter cellobiosi TaxID=2953654 RepID=UPI00208F0CBA|nr:hypothetical protein [Pseudarthrobacter sp. HLT1-5]MCO4257228.1 hypothetical protein [Pseudarthrobacter sp. HLT1-5]
MQQALNRALDEVLADNAKAVIFGEDCGRLGGVFRITDGLQAKYGEARVFDTPLAESGILGMSVGLAMAGFHPIPEVQFDGFAYPAINQIVCQIARMNYRSRGTLPMPITLRVPSFGGIRAPEHHGESLEALFAHVPGLKVVSPVNPHEAYHLLKYAASRPDPVIFMEPKSRYWQKGEVDVANADAGGGSPHRRQGHARRPPPHSRGLGCHGGALPAGGRPGRRGRRGHRGPGPALAQAHRYPRIGGIRG